MLLKTTVIRKVKRGGGFGRWPAYEFARDEYGRWLYSPKGTIYRGYDKGGRVVDIEVGQGTRSEGLPVMHLIPRSAWWLAGWYELDGVRRVTVEICTPAQLVEGEWSFVDLELDPQWSAGGDISVEDEEEFDAAVASGIISSYEAVEARAAADDVVARMRDGLEPFGGVGWRRYKDALASEMAAIRELLPTA